MRQATSPFQAACDPPGPQLQELRLFRSSPARVSQRWRGRLSGEGFVAKGTAQLRLVGIPEAPKKERALAPAFKLLEEFETERRLRFDDLGVPYVPDEELQPAFVVMAIATMKAQAGELLFEVFDAFLQDEWAAGLTPPWPFRVLRSPKVFPRMLEKARSAHDGR